VKVRYSATFEFDAQAPVTHRGTVAATTMPTCFARAARDAAKAHPGLRWTSMVIVLLERVEAEQRTEAQQEPPAESTTDERKWGESRVELDAAG